MATGQYNRAEVLRIVTAEGLTSRSGQSVDEHTFSNILRNTVYMGLTRSKTEPPHPGLHAPLVSEETFLTVQDVLAGRRRKYVPRRKVNPAFPLKGIRCTVCGAPLTGYNAKGKMGKLYAYYDCKACGAVRVPAAKLEGDFMDLLSKLQPRPEIVTEFPKVAARVWYQKQGEYEKSRKAITKQLETQQRLLDSLMDKMLENKITETDYRRNAARYETVITELQANLRTLDDNQANLEHFVRFAELSLVDMRQVWDTASPDQKIGVRTLLFGDTLSCSPEKKISNSDKPNLFNVLSGVNAVKTGDGAP